MPRVFAIVWVGLASLLAAVPALAAELVLQPQDTTIRFTLGATLHTVEGTARLTSGSLRFDPGGGRTEGRIVIDATSLDTGNGRRDAKLHADVLESERFPEISFAPERLEVTERAVDQVRVVLIGRVAIHGDEHPLRIPATVRIEGQRLRLEAAFTIPFVEWGMRDPSNFLLSVEKEVRVSVDALASPTPRASELRDARTE